MVKIILYAGTNEDISNSISECIQNRGYFVDYFQDPKKAIASLKKHTYDLGIVDMTDAEKFKKYNDLLEKLKEKPDFPVITIGYESQADQSSEKSDAHLNKPINLIELIANIEKHINPQE